MIPSVSLKVVHTPLTGHTGKAHIRDLKVIFVAGELIKVHPSIYLFYSKDDN